MDGDETEVDGAEVDGAEVDRAKVDGAVVDGAEVNGAEVDGAEVDGAESWQHRVAHRIPHTIFCSILHSKRSVRYRAVYGVERDICGIGRYFDNCVR